MYGNIKHTKMPYEKKFLRVASVQSWHGGGEGEGARKRMGIMSGGRPVFVSVMFTPRARIR